MHKLVPSRELIYGAVAHAYMDMGTTVDKINSASRRTEAVVPRGFCIYLMRFVAGFDIPELVKITGYNDRQVKRILEDARVLFKTDAEHCLRVMSALTIIANETFSLDGRKLTTPITSTPTNDPTLF